MPQVRTIIKLESLDENVFHIHPLGSKKHCKHETNSSQPVCRNISSPLRIIKIDNITWRWRYEDRYPVNDRHGDDLEVLVCDGPDIEARISKDSD